MSESVGQSVSQRPRIVTATSANAGAVALVQLHGEGAVQVLKLLTRIDDWPAGRLRLVEFDAIDGGLAVVLQGRGGGPWVQLSPHGGVRVVQRLLDRLVELGATHEPEPNSRQVYPEVGSALEADMLAAMAMAASPAAIDLLARQPDLWSRAAKEGVTAAVRQAVLTRSEALDRLITPATVVLVGPPNVGKSTLTNRMMGRAASIVADLPGTTRDWVAGLVELSSAAKKMNDNAAATNSIAVRWFDTPGLRTSDDPIEQHAIALARQVIHAADVLIAIRDSEHDWPSIAQTGREPDIWIVNKVDDVGTQPADAGRSGASPLAISAVTGRGIDDLHKRIVTALGLADWQDRELWAFSPTLRQFCERGDARLLAGYVD